MSEVTTGPVRPVGRPVAPVQAPTWLVASTTRRAAAYFLDLVLVFLLWATLSYLIGAVVGTSGGPDPLKPANLSQPWLSGVPVVVDLLYFVALWVIAGRTAGMRLLGLRVVSAADRGRLHVRPALVRWVALTWPSLLVFVDMVDASLWLATSLVSYAWYIVLLAGTARSFRHQGPHDRLAGSLVLRGTGRT